MQEGTYKGKEGYLDESTKTFYPKEVMKMGTYKGKEGLLNTKTNKFFEYDHPKQESLIDKASNIANNLMSHYTSPHKGGQDVALAALEIPAAVGTGMVSLLPAVGSMLIPTMEDGDVGAELNRRLKRAHAISDRITYQPKSPVAQKIMEPINEIMGFIPEKARQSTEIYEEWAEDAAKKGNAGIATFYKTIASVLPISAEGANLYLLGKAGEYLGEAPGAIKEGTRVPTDFVGEEPKVFEHTPYDRPDDPTAALNLQTPKQRENALSMASQVATPDKVQRVHGNLPVATTNVLDQARQPFPETRDMLLKQGQAAQMVSPDTVNKVYDNVAPRNMLDIVKSSSRGVVKPKEGDSSPVPRYDSEIPHRDLADKPLRSTTDIAAENIAKHPEEDAMRPAVIDDKGTVHEGEVGDRHNDIIEKTGIKESQRVFKDKDGNILNRQEATEKLKQDEPNVGAKIDNEPLHSEDLNKAREKVSKKPAEEKVQPVERRRQQKEEKAKTDVISEEKPTEWKVAVKSGDGEVITGKPGQTHAQIIEDNPQLMWGDQTGFVGKDGEFITQMPKKAEIKAPVQKQKIDKSVINKEIEEANKKAAKTDLKAESEKQQRIAELNKRNDVIDSKENPTEEELQESLDNNEEIDRLQGGGFIGSVEGTPIVSKERESSDVKKTILDSINNEKGSFDIGTVFNGIKRYWDRYSSKACPRSIKAGTDRETIRVAADRIAPLRIVEDWLSKISPKHYKDDAHMNMLCELIGKDNIVDGYFDYRKQAQDIREKAYNLENIDKTNKVDFSKIKDLEREADALDKAADEIAYGTKDGKHSGHNIDQYLADLNYAKQDKEIAQEIQNFKDNPSKDLEEMWRKVKRINKDAPEDPRGYVFGARINLLLKENEVDLAKYFTDENKASIPDSSIKYRHPDVKYDRFDRRAKFTHEYSTDMRLTLLNAVSHRYRNMVKVDLYDKLLETGSAIDTVKIVDQKYLDDHSDTELKLGQKIDVERPDNIQGYKPAMLAFKLPETTESGGTKMVDHHVWVREDLEHEILNALDTDMSIQKSKFANAITNIQILSSVDALSHVANLTKTIANVTTGKFVKDSARFMPGYNLFDAGRKIMKVSDDIMADTPEIRERMADLAKNGMLREQHVASRVLPLKYSQKLIYKADTAARMILDDMYTEGVKRGVYADSYRGRFDFVNQAGMYNRRLMTDFMRRAKDQGWAPFIVAGKTFNKMGVKMITGDPGVKAATNMAALQMRAINLSKLYITANLLCITSNMYFTGKPFGRPGTPWGAIDWGMEEKEYGKHRVFDVFQAVGARRGFGVFGGTSLIEGTKAGLAPDQIAWNMFAESVSTNLHPLLGPARQFAATVALGQKFDPRAKEEGKKYPGSQIRQIAENTRAALEQTNPALYSLIRPTMEKWGWDEMGGKRLTSLGETLEDKTHLPMFSEAADALFLKPVFGAAGGKDVFPPQSSTQKRAKDIAGATLPQRGGLGRADKERLILIDNYSRKLENLKPESPERREVINNLRKDFKDKKIGEHDIKTIEQNLKAGSELIKTFKSASFTNAKEIWDTSLTDKKLPISEKINMIDTLSTKIDNLSEEDQLKNKEFIRQFVKDAKQIVRQYKQRKEFGTK